MFADPKRSGCFLPRREVAADRSGRARATATATGSATATEYRGAKVTAPVATRPSECHGGYAAWTERGGSGR